MKPVYQTIFDAPLGNCLQACVASIFELPLTSVPNFNERQDDWGLALEEFCQLYGLSVIVLDRANHELTGYKAWSIVTGHSPRGEYLHAVVAYDGNIKHDPHPGGNCELRGLVDEIMFLSCDPSKAYRNAALEAQKKGEK